MTDEQVKAIVDAAMPFAAYGWVDAEQEDDNCKLTTHGPITVGQWRALRRALRDVGSW